LKLLDLVVFWISCKARFFFFSHGEIKHSWRYIYFDCILLWRFSLMTLRPATKLTVLFNRVASGFNPNHHSYTNNSTLPRFCITMVSQFQSRNLDMSNFRFRLGPEQLLLPLSLRQPRAAYYSVVCGPPNSAISSCQLLWESSANPFNLLK
jgi:hypothetical protein